MLDEQGTYNFGIYLDRTLKAVRLDMHRRFKEVGIDITPEQWVLLSALYERDGMSQAELAGNSYKDAPTVSRIIDLLDRKKLIQRVRIKEDRRSYQVTITPEGKATVEKALPAVLNARKKGWSGLTAEDHKVFLRIMDQIFQNFGEE
jgi:DNA-binding MarR family transcriptional regulator